MTDSDYELRVKQRVAGVFGRAAEAYDTLGPRSFAYWGRRLVELAEIRGGARVLDVGTGRGEELFPAAERVGTTGYVVGIDLVDEMVRLTSEEVRQRGLKNASVCQMDAEELAFADSSFDYVVSSNVLFLCPQPRRALAEMARVLEPGGRVAAIPSGGAAGRIDHGADGDWFIELIRPYLARSDVHRRLQQEFEAARSSQQQTEQSPISAETPEVLEEALRRAGFADIQMTQEQVEFVFADEEEWWNWQWSHWRRNVLERLARDDLELFKSAVFEKLRSFKGPEGFHSQERTLLALATKPD